MNKLYKVEIRFNNEEPKVSYLTEKEYFEDFLLVPINWAPDYKLEVRR